MKLEDLVVDEREVASTELASALGPYVRFTASGGLLLEPGFKELHAEHQVLCVLLALQALRMLGYRDTDQASPAQIVELSGMAPGTVRPKLSGLLKARHVTKSAGGSYSLPLHEARRAISLLERKT